MVRFRGTNEAYADGLLESCMANGQVAVVEGDIVSIR